VSTLEAYLDVIFERWRHEKIPHRPGVDVASISEFELRYAVTLPEDMREFYSTVDGMGEHYDEDSFFRFWPLEQVQPIDHYYPDLGNLYPASQDYFLFFDHSIDLFMYAIRLQRDANAATPIARLYPQDDGSFEPAFDSFTEVLVRYANDPDDLL
jgi:hypothetical protein